LKKPGDRLLHMKSVLFRTSFEIVFELVLFRLFIIREGIDRTLLHACRKLGSDVFDKLRFLIFESSESLSLDALNFWP